MKGVEGILKPLEIVYWLRLGLGFIAALLCAGYGMATGAITSDLTKIYNPTTLMNSIAIALAFYLISYYAIKPKFVPQVAKPQKLVTTGIGIYFLSWLVLWVLLYAAMAG